MRGQVTRSATRPSDVWAVPSHMRGLACQACGHFFQDGESHGELDLVTGEIICKSRVLQVTNRPSLALIRRVPTILEITRRLLAR